MEIMIYSDEQGIYKMVDFNESHNELLFRCRKTGEIEYNIDILFKGVYSLNSVTTYRGIHISIIPRQTGFTVSNVANRDFIIKISDNAGLLTYIDAIVVGGFKNHLDYQISSLGEFTWSNVNELLFWSKDMIGK